MKYPLWVAGLAFFVLCSLLALSNAQWHLAGVPVWQWAAAVAAGGMGMLGAALMQQSPPIRRWSFQSLVFGSTYSLPMLFIGLVFPAGRGPVWISLPIWIVGGAVFGLIMANAQTQGRAQHAQPDRMGA